MAGGIGTRFWPFSRTNNPKQFHDVLGSGQTLLQATAARFDGICPPENLFIVTSQEYIGRVQEQLPFLTPDQILAEPHRRNTAPCIGYACFKIGARNPKANIVVAPADAIIQDTEEFRERIQIALDATANADVMVTLGIKPSRPDTGYGYIQFLPNRSEVKQVKTFTEKPHLELAEAFLASGDFVWNAGIFVWNAQTIMNAFKSFLPEMDEVFRSGMKHYFTENETDYINNGYKLCRNVSIDYGIMEKAQNVHVVLSDFGWSDLGTWKSLYEVSEKDENQNVIDGQTMLYDTKNCIIKTPHDRLVVVQGLEGYIIAEYENVLMICRKDEEQKVKEFVTDAKERGNQFA